jgi:MscS family membrane protein
MPALLQQLGIPQTDELVPLSERLINRLPESWHWLKDVTIAGNALWQVVALFLSLLVAMLIGRIVRVAIVAAGKRSERRGHHLVAVGLAAGARSVGLVALLVGLTVGIGFLTLGAAIKPIADTVLRVLWTTVVGFVVYQLIDVVDHWLTLISSRTASRLDDMLVPLVRKSLRGTIVVLVLVQIATDIAGEQVTSIIAGLGVGGLAVGLAAQDTVKNFFGSMMIFGDRPFELGDEIALGNIGGLNIGGTVESVGFRSTRFRNSEGHLVTIPNGDLANKTITNISRQSSLLRKFTVALKQDTPPDKVQRAIELIKQALADHEGMKPNKPARVFLQEITPQGLVISIQYWYHPADNMRFSAFSERINLEILRRLAGEEIALQKV